MNYSAPRLHKRISCYFISLSIVLSLSPVFCDLIGVKGNVLYILFVLGAGLFSIRSIRFTNATLLILLYSAFAICLFSVKWQELGLMLYLVYFILAIVICSLLESNDFAYISRIITVLLFIELFGAVVGFTYAFLGGGALFEINNPDGRLASLFLSTMTNWRMENVIRPAGFFDEPGALSFVICAVCSLREILGLNRRVSLLMLTMGLITLSVAHVIYCVFFLLSEKIKIHKFVIASFFSIIIFSLMLSFGVGKQIYNKIDDVFLSRFEIVDGRVMGDNRSELLVNAYNILDDYGWFWGGGASCIYNPEQCNDTFPPFGENILSPAALTGIVVAAPYYILLAYLALFAFKKRSYMHLFGFMLILTQRPYLFSFGYALLILLVVYSFLDGKGIVGE